MTSMIMLAIILVPLTLILAGLGIARVKEYGPDKKLAVAIPVCFVICAASIVGAIVAGISMI